MTKEELLKLGNEMEIIKKNNEDDFKFLLDKIKELKKE